MKFRADVHHYDPQTGASSRVSPGDGIYYQPCIHPDGISVVYSGGPSGAPRIWKTDLASGDTVALTGASYAARHPAFSSDGRWIVFSSDKACDQPQEDVSEMLPTGAPPTGHNGHIFVMAADGSQLHQITQGLFLDQRPTFSPDGSHVALVSARGGRVPSLYRVPLGAPFRASSQMPEPEALIPGRPFAYRPWYSPEGRWIYAFIALESKRHQIARIPAEGGALEPLANDDRGVSHGPWVDPKGEVILMHSTRDGAWGVWELPLDGSAPTKLDLPGLAGATHATRASNGSLTFDRVVLPART
jgi:Tol biopolymer transport system component